MVITTMALVISTSQAEAAQMPSLFQKILQGGITKKPVITDSVRSSLMPALMTTPSLFKAALIPISPQALVPTPFA